MPDTIWSGFQVPAPTAFMADVQADDVVMLMRTSALVAASVVIWFVTSAVAGSCFSTLVSLMFDPSVYFLNQVS